MPVLQIVCLANSRKHQGRCIAGLRTDGAGWLRPLGRGHDGALSPDEYRLPDGSDAKLLDVLELEVVEHRPAQHQPENWTIGSNRWRLVKRPAPASFAPIIKACCSEGPLLFGDTSDRIAYAQLAKSRATASLALVSPDLLYFRTLINRVTGRWQARACLELNGGRYDLGLTDPECEERLCTLPVGDHEPEEIGFPLDRRIALTVSLGEPFHDYCDKLVAGVIVIPKSW